MKEIKRTIESYEFVFVAIDGTEFKDKEECRKYEESARGLLMTKFMPLVVKEKTEFQIFGAGNDDSAITIVKLESQADADIVLQLFLLYNPYMAKEDRKNDLDAIAKRIRLAADEKDYIFIGSGYERDEFWFGGTRNEHINCLNKICETPETSESAEEK